MSHNRRHQQSAGRVGGAETRSQKRGRVSSQQQQQQRARIYEPYWTREAVDKGIKRGDLIVGSIRINPKNYEDAYVPMPDGMQDIYISGMSDRNRALNSDDVVVSLYPFDKWRVFMEEFEDYERSLSDGKKKAIDESDDEDTSEITDASSSDSGPDVIYDSDSGSSNSDGDDELERTEKMKSSMRNMQISKAAGNKETAQTAKSKSTKSEKSATPGKKFTTVSDLLKNGSTLAKDLFGKGREGHVQGSDIKGDKFVQPRGKVVYIYERKHSRAASGHIKLMQDKSKRFALFSPTDSRVPRIMIPMADCPKDFYERSEDYARTLFIARIQEWDEAAKMPKGTLARSLGEAGQIEPETEAMLIELSVDDSQFSNEVTQCLPKNFPWSIPESEFSYRRDLRRFCVFTIDPSTARDLDDAVSIEELGNGKFQVGVHIADVSYFVEEDTELDKVAFSRATSVYLVQKVIPMLPQLLCEELCSLNPDCDRLTFTVMWTIDEQGLILDEWYGRSVIRSCAKLSYDHAQGFIDHPEKNWTQEELPPITNSFTVKDVMKRVLLLHKLAINLRKQRFENGALRLDQVKLQFILNSETGLPNGYFVYEQKDSNRLIEEFMLLANMAVAHKIVNSFPDKAVLRRHPAPQLKPLEAVEQLCESLGLDINTASAGDLQHSLQKYYGDDKYSQARLQVLIVLVSKPMKNARYFCSGIFPDDALYRHYALNVPLYTHFTSPIRRYPDIMVHRLLAASLGYSPVTSKPTGLLQTQAEYCNDKKYNSKLASDRSSDMYFAIFVKEAGPLEEKGMVMAVLDKSFDVLILKFGVTKRVYLNKLSLKSAKFRKNKKCPELMLLWAPDEKYKQPTKHLITLFTMVDCCVFADSQPLQVSCVIKRPKKEIGSKGARYDDDDDDTEEEDEDMDEADDESMVVDTGKS